MGQIIDREYAVFRGSSISCSLATTLASVVQGNTMFASLIAQHKVTQRLPPLSKVTQRPKFHLTRLRYPPGLPASLSSWTNTIIIRRTSFCAPPPPRIPTRTPFFLLPATFPSSLPSLTRPAEKKKHLALRPQKPFRLIRDGEVGGGGSGNLYLLPNRYTVTSRMTVSYTHLTLPT